MTTDRTAAVVDAIGAAKVVPVLRSSTRDDAQNMLERLVEGGIRVIELTATTPEWSYLLAWGRNKWPEVTIGVGTVVTEADARRAVERGADFLVSPYAAAQVRAVAGAVPFIEGGLTPTELAASVSHAGLAKVFPAHVGGPKYLASVLQIMPEARLIPTGGISLGQVGDYLRAGAFAVGVGRDLTTADDVAGALTQALDDVSAT